MEETAAPRARGCSLAWWRLQRLQPCQRLQPHTLPSLPQLAKATIEQKLSETGMALDDLGDAELQRQV